MSALIELSRNAASDWMKFGLFQVSVLPLSPIFTANGPPKAENPYPNAPRKRNCPAPVPRARVNVPLEMLSDTTRALDDKNRWLEEWLREKREQRQVRFYQESTVMFDE